MTDHVVDQFYDGTTSEVLDIFYQLSDEKQQELISLLQFLSLPE